MRRNLPRSAAVAAALVLSNCALIAATMAGSVPPPAGDLVGAGVAQAAPEPLYVVRVAVRTQADVLRLVNGGWDVLEMRGPDYLLVMADAEVIKNLRADGFTVDIDHAIDPVAQRSPFTYYGGYRTVAEHYAHLDQVAVAYPGLASVIDYGDSWRKVNSLPTGHDLKAMCITNRQPGDCALSPTSAKPRFLLMAAIHARELSTAELAYRWIDYLTQNYNVDADVTMLLDHTELWVIPLVNPDGRNIVEGGGSSPYLQRKNANNTAPGSNNCANPPTASSQFGVDLNRNASTANWGGAGTTTSVCAQTYKGVGPASEPEEYYLEQLFANLFPDTKGANRNDPASTGTRGAFITLHSYGNLVLLPYGDATTGGYAPNDAALRSLAFRMSYYNAYQTGTGDEVLYPTTGTTDDWMYGVLGVPGFTFEVGAGSGSCSGFTPSYSCQDGTFWPLNRPAFMYAAKSAREPYLAPFGPTTANVAVSASSAAQGATVTLSANANDNAYGSASGSVGRPAAQTVAAAEYYIDTPPWAGGTPVAMSASDGSFNANNENVTASVNTAALSLGRHTLFVRSRDAGGNWGPVSAVFLTVTAPGATPTPTPTATPGPTPTPTATPGAGGAQTFANAAAVSVPTSGNASPYPSTISVSGMSGVVSKVVVRLKGLTHTYPDDLDVLLVSPGGQKLLLLSDAGGSGDVNGVTLTFDGSAASTLGNSSQISTGTYRPTNHGTGDTFPAPAPGTPYASALTTFNGSNPNGSWSLYVRDDASGDGGSLAQGWELTITTGAAQLAESDDAEAEILPDEALDKVEP